MFKTILVEENQVAIWNLTPSYWESAERWSSSIQGIREVPGSLDRRRFVETRVAQTNASGLKWSISRGEQPASQTEKTRIWTWVYFDKSVILSCRFLVALFTLLCSYEKNWSLRCACRYAAIIRERRKAAGCRPFQSIHMEILGLPQYSASGLS